MGGHEPGIYFNLVQECKSLCITRLKPGRQECSPQKREAPWSSQRPIEYQWMGAEPDRNAVRGGRRVVVISSSSMTYVDLTLVVGLMLLVIPNPRFSTMSFHPAFRPSLPRCTAD